FDNPCGDHLRAFMINAFIDDKFAWKLPPEQNLHLDHEHEGYPAFKYWPHQTSKLHQQMWYEWIKRAHEGGLNVMVALSVNSQLLANAINGDSPTLDRASSDLQITEIKRFVKRHADFMEIAFSSADLRRIVGAGKLAVILGMEIDDFGGFAQMGTVFKNQTHTMQRAQVKAEIKRVYDQGVRYLFPIHLSNNVFGGSAVYSSIFNFANKHNTGSFMDITTSPDPAIQYNLNFLNAGTPLVLSMVPGVYDAIAGFPAPCFGSGIPGTVGSCSPALGIIKDAVTADGKWVNYQSVVPGHINDQGLTPLGEYALLEMMKLGMIIDIDHMGMKSTEMALHWAEVFKGGYPVNLGHNGLRQNDEHHHATERNADAATIRRVAKLQGMFGLGTGDLTPDEFIEEYNKVVKAIEGLNMIDALQGRTQLYGALAVGTDANGLEPLPRATAGLDSAAFYSNGFKKLDTAGGAAKGGKTWDYTKEGVAHYGLMNEFMRDVKARNKDQNVYKRVWDSAEYFARMWEKCESLSDK
ncbi:MAG: hypothetical protein HOP19_20490, partial [Acidobacteria bacterium]|nr:hypothetical protein [Acidobacteriota bacterium]